MKKTLPPSASAHSSLFMNWRFENMGFCQRSRGQYLLCYNHKHEGTRTLDLLNHFTSPGLRLKHVMLHVSCFVKHKFALSRRDT